MYLTIKEQHQNPVMEDNKEWGGVYVRSERSLMCLDIAVPN